MFARVAIATDNAGQGPIVTARDEVRFGRATASLARQYQPLSLLYFVRYFSFRYSGSCGQTVLLTHARCMHALLSEDAGEDHKHHRWTDYGHGRRRAGDVACGV